LAGSNDGNGVNASFSCPQSLVIYNNTLFLAEDFRVRRITLSVDVSTYAGNGIRGYVNGNLMAARFNFLNGITVDKFGNFYLADCFNHVIRMISNTGIVSTFAGGRAGSDDGYGNISLQKLR
jgi:hypothetical protein